jgi:hypothetical protein
MPGEILLSAGWCSGSFSLNRAVLHKIGDQHERPKLSRTFFLPPHLILALGTENVNEELSSCNFGYLERIDKFSHSQRTVLAEIDQNSPNFDVAYFCAGQLVIQARFVVAPISGDHEGWQIGSIQVENGETIRHRLRFLIGWQSQVFALIQEGLNVWVAQKLCMGCLAAKFSFVRHFPYSCNDCS